MIWGYTRVSTGRAASEGESLDEQERKIAGYAMSQLMPAPVMIIERGVSGSVPLGERPRGRELIDQARPGDVIITPKLDRMFRSALDALQILKDFNERKIALHMMDLGGDVTNNGISKLVFTILSAVAEAERDRIRERVSGVKADQRARGHYLGGKIPFGHAVRYEHDAAGKVTGRLLVPDPVMHVKIAEMRQLRANGLTLRGVRDALGIDISLDAIHRICSETA